MDKYSKAVFTVIKIPTGIFCILLGIGLIGVSFYVSTFSDVASMILIISFLGGGALINYGIGYAFLGDEYKATNMVRGGNTKFAIKETPKLLKRRKIVLFIGFIAYLVLTIYYIVRIILDIIFMEHLQEIYFNTSIVALIFFAIIFIVVAFCLFMIYKKTKHIDLKEE